MSPAAAVNTQETILKAVSDFDALAPRELEPFWGHMMPELKGGFWGPAKQTPHKPVLFVSGPGRNGNHLVHSMMDNHPQVARAGGEDAFLAAFFNACVQDQEAAIEKLRGPQNIEAILDWSGHGFNKWKLTAEMSREGNVRETKTWAGVHDKVHFVSDYQDTAVSVDYESYEKRLRELAEPIRRAETFVDIFWMYLDAVSRLDAAAKQDLRFPYIYVGSGMRAEMKFLLSRGAPLKCVAPIRPFETFYYSFAKGRMKSDEQIDQEILQLAWDHWHHKAIDYMLLKKQYPEAICLVNFTHLIENPEATAREVCRFLQLDFSDACLTPTSMGIPTKGNSSFPKPEEKRGTFYKESLTRKLDSKYWPELYPGLWKMVERLAV
jgi:hypothetical protein